MESLINHPWYLFIRDVVTFLFTFTGLIIAGMGLATWKKQLKGTKEFDAAYNLNYSVLKLRDAIKHVRNPWIPLSESRKAVEYSKSKYPEKSTEDAQKDSHVSVYEMRWEEIIKAFTEVESHLLAAEVLWGADIVSLMKPLNMKVTELNIALKQNFQPDIRTKDPMELHKVIYERGDGTKGGEDDAFSQEVNKAIKGIRDYLQGKMS